jgi:hypothetical protein
VNLKNLTVSACREYARTAIQAVLLSFVAVLPAISNEATAAHRTVCDNSLKNSFKPDPLTTVTLVKEFKKGQDLSLGDTPTGKIAASDLCVVKLNVGPGNAGPPAAPSTSPGIGMEIWLPTSASWNKRIHVLGGGGFAGEPEVSSLTALSAGYPWVSPAEIAGIEGAVSGVTDAGHSVKEPGPAPAGLNGSFGMNPDGSINTRLWEDLSARGVHELAVKAKELAFAFYGQKQSFSYYEGCSTGGRQALKEVQNFPADFDGVLGGDAAINWTRFITSEMYPQIVMQRDLGGSVLSPAQLDLVSAAAVSACDTDLNGTHSGYLSNPALCHYDPMRDQKVLCKADGGLNESSACVNRTQARAINKLWFGQTVDGHVPDPASANGFSATLLAKQLWWGVPRGTSLAKGYDLAATHEGKPQPFILPTHQLALELRNPGLATPSFINATGNGESGWMALTYADLARAHDAGVAQQREFAHIDTDNPDISGFRDHHGKLLYYHGMADQVIVIQGSDNYFTRVNEKLGGAERMKDTYRYLRIPGMGHCFGIGSVNGSPDVSPPADPPLPANGQLYSALVNWVERNQAPDNLVIKSKSGSVERPVCAFPTELKYVGGDRASASSYTCK